MKLRGLRLGATVRVGLGLVSLTIGLLFVADLLFGVIADDTAVAQRVRQGSSESLAVQLTALIQADDRRSIARTLEAAVSQNKDTLSVAIRRADGEIIAQAGEHARHWVARADRRSTVTHVQVPIYSGKSEWGRVEISFKPIKPDSLLGWLDHPGVRLALVLVVGGFALYYLYLRRVLEHLDPSAVIPDRVRSAFDILAEGVLIVDLKGRIVLANRAFRSLHPEAKAEMLGKRISGLGWLTAKLPAEPEAQPWAQAIQQKAPIPGVSLEIVQEEGDPRQVIVNCSPVLDGRREVRGCLITFDDVTELDRANQKLLATLRELEASRTRIELQNEELKKLASHDSLTGCLNRRAFFERAQVLFDEAKRSGGELCVIMADIDHFKAVNDTHGHAVGDQVIQHFAKLLLTSLRGADLLCRYGGEEFCVALPGASLEVALAVAERIRAKIEAECGPGVRSVPDLRVTSSAGVSSIDLGAANIPALVDQADQALYVAKKTGRNRVNSYAKIAERSQQPVAAALHRAALQDARTRRQQRVG